MTILISGATGSVGRHLVDELLARGQTVRAITRAGHPSGLPDAVHVVKADLSEVPPGSFDDVDRVFVFPANRGVDSFTEAAVAAGVERFVVLSSLAAAQEHPRDIGSSSAVHHLWVEAAVTTRTSGWSILRPGTFASNLLAWAHPIRSELPIRAPYLRSAQAPIHEADVAAAAAALLMSDGHRGTIHALSGPQSLTRIEQVEAIGSALGRRITLEEISPEEFRQQMAAFMPEGIISMLLDYWRDTVAQPDIVRSGMQDLTGRPGRTLAQWANDHRADFTGN